MAGCFVIRRRAEILDGFEGEGSGEVLESPCGGFRVTFRYREADGCFEIGRVGTSDFSDWEIVRLDTSYVTIGAYRVVPGGDGELIYDRESEFGCESEADELTDDLVKLLAAFQSAVRQKDLLGSGR